MTGSAFPGESAGYLIPNDDVLGHALIEAFAEQEVRAGLSGPTSVLVEVPDDRPLTLDVTPVREQARTIALEDMSTELPPLIRGFVRGVIRSCRRGGVRIGTHYPLPDDDAAGHALLRAFADAGTAAVFTDPVNLRIPLPEGEHVTADTGRFRTQADAALPGELPELARAFAEQELEVFARRERRRTDLGDTLDRLRLRVYSEEAMEPRFREQFLTRELAPGLRETVVADYPDSISPLERSAADGHGVSDDQVFLRAIEAAIEAEPVDTEVMELRDVPLLHITGRHRYVGAHVHVLARHLGSASREHGALVAFPIPELLLVHRIGAAHVIHALETMQDLAARHAEVGHKAISAQIYWWRPGEHERLDENRAPEPGRAPRLEPVRMEVDHEAKSIALHSSDDFSRMVAELTGM
ncbi:hypothetical protein HDA32_000338 [Spinactinospora alkalitolerans]|uniref:Uncharacterized protein n=1 Tax=Spinactinospora alkalitolerans TaxID=687207 RepID=A0A852TMR4_9ACTN|nr:hypothetical protein [Spinactinospora alkalitolerans]NYE45218.1 hypothetical protein [Spinactinospora alkalitolerans]